MMTALQLYRSPARYLAARAVGQRVPGLLAGPLAPLRLVRQEEPRLPAPGWVRVRPRLSGICGSDLATLSGRVSFYFSPLVSMPFVPGHEVVGELLDDAGELPAGTRVVLDPLLACLARGLDPCPECAQGRPNRCDRITVGHVAPGLQTGYCADTGGGWGQQLAAHTSQLHPVPDTVPDERAVLTEPLACAVHTATRARPAPADHVLLIGAGIVGLATVHALAQLFPPARLTVVAKHRKQAELARRLGATDVLGPDEAWGAVRRSTRALRVDPERGAPFLLGGVDVAVDCVGSADSVATALRMTRAGGRVVLAGLPQDPVDLSPAWYRELDVVGSYASAGTPERDFARALQLLAHDALDALSVISYPLDRWRDALDHAASAGRLGTTKVAFTLERHA